MEEARKAANPPVLKAQASFDGFREQDVERAHVAPSMYPTQGGLERLHHEALSSILGTGSELQQIQGRDSSGIAIWTCTS